MTSMKNTGESGSLMSLTHFTSPHHLHPSDDSGTCLVSKVLGGDNYLIWQHAMTIALLAKNKMSFVNGSISQSSSPPSLVQAWTRCSNMVLS